MDIPLLDVALADDVEVTPDFRQSVGDILMRSVEGIGLAVTSLAAVYTRDLPFDWHRCERVQPLDRWENSGGWLTIAAILRLDLAIYVFKCTSKTDNNRFGAESGLHFGMEGLSHFCTSFEARPDERGHAMVLRILDILGLNPSTTSPLDLDRLDRRFLCPSHTLPTTFKRQVFRPWLTWREAASD